MKKNLVCGCDVEIDMSDGQGHCWVPAGYLVPKIEEEIAELIIEEGKETCEDYVASNGRHYRWS